MATVMLPVSHQAIVCGDSAPCPCGVAKMRNTARPATTAATAAHSAGCSASPVRIATSTSANTSVVDMSG